MILNDDFLHSDYHVLQSFTKLKMILSNTHKKEKYLKIKV